MALEDRVLHFRLRVPQRAQDLGNVSAACRELEVSGISHFFLQLEEKAGHL